MLVCLRNYAIVYVRSRYDTMYAVKYPSAYFDNNEQKVFFTRCNANGVGCGWEDEESYSDVADCTVAVCPECGCDDVVDESEYV